MALMSDAGRYSLVAWPPNELDKWIRGLQQDLEVRGFGSPHINLRAPFESALSSAELVNQIRRVLKNSHTLQFDYIGMKRFPYVFFLEFALSEAIRSLHFELLAGIQPSEAGPYDGEAYRPHLTLALCVLPNVADELWQQVEQLVPPVTFFEVNALSLTLEVRGEVQELHTFPLLDPNSD